MRNQPRIAISSEQTAVRVPRIRIAKLAELISRTEQPIAELDVAFLDDEQIELYNRRFVGHTGPTDVISFDVTGPDDEALAVQLLICGPVARQQAADHDQPITREILRYVAHGLLHQMGYDDQDAASAEVMHAREDELLEALAAEEKGRRR
ncbi:MAG: rRNA maturation RNase YbeY [Phycisphaerae bacterium]